MKLELKATSKKVPHTDRFGVSGTRIQYVVEAVIEGVSFTHDCISAEQSRALVVHLSQALGLKK